MMQVKTKTKLSMLVLLLIAVIWGFGYLCVDDALHTGWSSLGILSIRGLGGGIIALLFSIKEKWWKKPKFILYAFLIAIVNFLGYYLQTEGQLRTSVSNTAFFTALNVVMVPILAAIFFKEKLTIKSIVAALIGFAGIFTLTFDGSSFKFSLGDLLNFLCAICFAIQIASIPSLAKYEAPFALTGIQLICMGIFASALMPLFPQTTHIVNGAWLSILYVTFVSGFLAFFLQVICQKYVKSSTASLLLGQESFFGAIFAVLIANAPVTWQLIVGGFLVIISIIIVNINFKKFHNKEDNIAKITGSNVEITKVANSNKAPDLEDEKD